MVNLGTLKVGRINLNNLETIRELTNAIDRLIQIHSSYYTLSFKVQYYFVTPDGLLPTEKGWYILLDSKKPLYVGKAGDLNARLNTNNGSIDNFANEKRASDLERNFIKKFDELGIVDNLRVCIILEKNLCLELGLKQTDLTDLDRGNIEKIVDIFRTVFSYL